MTMPEFDKDLIIGPIEAKNALEAVKFVANHLVKAGYVRETFPAAVIAREKEFPTGLETDGPGVAIPHCDFQHVLKPGIAVATLTRPVAFRMMGNDQATVPVEIIIMLALTDPSLQIDILRQVSHLVQHKEILERLKVAGSREEVVDILRQCLVRPRRVDEVSQNG